MAGLEGFLRAWREGPLEAVPLDPPVPLGALHTPVLVVDLEQFECNLAFMQRYLDGAGLALRPHAKMHKCPVIAKRQLALGAQGVCAAKISEAEVLAAAGIEDILVTSPVATEEKARRLVELAGDCPGVKIVVDCEAGARLLQAECQAAGLALGVFIDLDPSMGRTGIAAGGPALALARYLLDECPALTFKGLQMYAGHCMHIEGYDKRRDKYQRVMQAGLDTREAFAQAGIEIPAFSGGGTGTYSMEPGLGLLTELQAGSYAFMDIEYRDIGGAENASRFEDFPVSLFVLATAISQPQKRLITVDAGFKSLATDKMPPEFRTPEGVQFHWGGDEHGIVALDNPSRQPQLGEKLELLAPHCDPTVNLHDWYFPYRDGMVSEAWPISARGCSQ